MCVIDIYIYIYTLYYCRCICVCVNIEVPMFPMIIWGIRGFVTSFKGSRPRNFAAIDKLEPLEKCWFLMENVLVSDGKVLVYDGKVLVYDGKVLVYDGKVLVYDGKVLVYEWL